MERFFLELLNRAICAGWLVPVILLLRLALKKMPKWVRCLLWGMVAVRLLVPIQIESLFSLIPSAQTVSPDVMYAEKPELHTGIGVLNSTVNPVIYDHLSPKPEDSVNPMQVITGVASWVWLTGMVIMLIYAAVSYVRLRVLVRTAVPAKGVRVDIPVLESERVASPFVLGLIRPRIYLPTGVDENGRNYIISHETAHVHRKDHWIKPFGYVLLAVYWFHPLLWAAYVMLCCDIEYACDERVVKRYNVEERKAYSTALLKCSVRRMHIAACPVAFGEVGVRQRIKSVLHYKKPTFWVLAAAALCCILVAVCFLTNPKEEAASGAGNGNAAEETTGAGDGNAAEGVTGEGNGNIAAGAADPENGNDPAGVAVPAEGRYVFDRCIYMNPLSSYIPMEGQEISGYLDADGMTWDEFGVQKRFLFEKADESANVDTVPWTVFEAEELKDAICRAWDGMLLWKIDARLEAIGELPAKKRLWRPLEDGCRLLYVDGELWLMRDGGESGVWSIYALRPQAEGVSESTENAGTIGIGASEADDLYEYYLTKEELMTDIEQGYLFRVDTSFSKPQIPPASGGNEYRAPYVSMGIWPFYVYEDNIVNLEIAFSNLLMKPNKNIFPGDEQIIVEVISPDGLSVYRFEKVGEEITKDTSIQEQISVTPGEWTLKISFAYVCGETPAHLKIVAAYETPSEEDLNWLKGERLTNRAGL